MSDAPLYELAERLGAELKQRGLMIATAESCTGGWISQAITAVPGSSEWFERGYVTYTYISKREMLGVQSDTLGTHGAVSEQTAREMALGAVERSHAQVSVAVSGTAGPTGGSPGKPVGTVCFAWAIENTVDSETSHFDGDREAVRRQAVAHALSGVLTRLSKQEK